MSKRQLTSAEVSAPLYPLQDMHKQFVQFVPLAEAQRLLKIGFAVSYGTKKKIIGIRLTVPLTAVSEDVPTARPLTPQIYAGRRYVLKEALNTPNGKHAYVYRLKTVLEEESPDLALRRMLQPPALEAPEHILYEKATDEERVLYSAWVKRNKINDVFKMVARPRRRRHEQQAIEPHRGPFLAPLKKDETKPELPLAA